MCVFWNRWFTHLVVCRRFSPASPTSTESSYSSFAPLFQSALLSLTKKSPPNEVKAARFGVRPPHSRPTLRHPNAATPFACCFFRLLLPGEKFSLSLSRFVRDAVFPSRIRSFGGGTHTDMYKKSVSFADQSPRFFSFLHFLFIRTEILFIFRPYNPRFDISYS